MTRNLLVFAAVLLHLLWMCVGESIILKVEPKSEDCFYEDYQRGSNVDLTYAVLEGGLLDIEVRVFQAEVKIFTKLHFEGRDEGRYSFVTSQDGPVGFCFNNEMSRFTVKTVMFEVARKPVDKVTKEDLTPFEQSLERMSRGMDVIEQEQSYHRVREHAHRNTAESTNTRVYAWSLVESAVLLLMSVGQVWYLRRLFDDKRGGTKGGI